MGINLRKGSIATYCALAVAVLVGCYLRLRNIKDTGLWLDEAFSVAVSDPDNSFIDVFRATLSDVHPPFYQILLWAYYHCFGFSEFSGRYLSAGLGVLLIPSVFVLGRKLLDERVALVFAWLVAINYFLIGYSHETRSYALLVFLTVVSFIVFLRCVRQSGFFDFCCYSVVSALLVNTHYYGYLIVLVQASWVFCSLLEKSLPAGVFYRFMGAGFFTALTFVPGFSYTKRALARHDFWISPPEDMFFFRIFLVYFGDAFLAFLAAMIFIAGFILFTINDQRKEPFRLLVFWLVLGVAVPYICSVYFLPVTTYRNFIILLPAVLLVMAFAVDSIRDKVIKALVLTLFLCFSATPILKDISKFADEKSSGANGMQIREIVRSVIGKKSALPVYSSDDIQFGVYFKLLGSKVHVEDLAKLETDLGSASPPEEFYFLETTYFKSLALNEEFLKRFNLVLVSKEEMNEVRLLELRSLKP
ncbi:glycosyltransferase family 39 protein [Pseudomonas sp. 13B_3.2_Bac1]|uniref:glycosyltransferase family 39 protein n=1 Tax=Pseudomonas sp. 13B_3.2_Bac1 TaxID=2971623 RepID=UPI0021C7BFDE|nr:glycosyltransferase family 39 protein [Pseudomonas sp. 13B_3.2_Bac1]MCU1772297.1 glycosyltransferase family 39 protein [Pseudomonas sp. 13B_3.2_Bac1]